MDKNQREARRRQEDKALNHGLLWVAGAVVLEAVLIFVNRYYINIKGYEIDTALLIHSIMVAIRIGGFVVGAAALAWAVLQFCRGGKASLPFIGCLVCWALALCCHVVIGFNKSGMQMLLLLVPALAGLALVFYLYQREFFLAATASGMAALALWFVRFSAMVPVVILAVGILLVGAAALWLKKNGGLVRRPSGEEIRFMSKNTSYALILASCLIGLAAVAASLLLGSTVAYYLVFAMVAWMFALLVYYTVKLM